MDKIKTLRNLLAAGETGEVIRELLSLTENTTLHNQVIHQSARFSTYQLAKQGGTESFEDLEYQLNQIHEALAQIIEKLDKSPAKPWSWWKYVVAVGVLVGIVAGIVSSLKHLGVIGNDQGSSDYSVTVLVHGKDGKDDIILPNRGLVYLVYGDAKVAEQINNEGEATFKQIGQKYFENDVRVELLFEDPLGEPYRAANPDSMYQLQPNQHIALEVILEGMDRLEGTVKDFVTGEPLDSVLVRLRGYSFYTNSFGEFTIEIPQERQEQFIDLRFSKRGYEPKELSKVPTTTKQAQIISLKPIQ